MNFSYWEQTSFLRHRDVLIIGAGIVGVNAAIELKQADHSLNITVVDRGSLPSGASTKNAGFACVGSISEITHDLTHNSYEAVTQLIWERWQGLVKLRERVGDSHMNYQACGGYELFEHDDVSTYLPVMEKLNNTFQTVFSPLYAINNSKTTSVFKACIETTCEGSLHPGKMMQRLIQLAQGLGVQFIWNCPVTGWEEDNKHVNVFTSLGNLSAGEVLITTNGFTHKLLPNLELKPARNQVLITQPIPTLPWEGTFHVNKGYIYFRNVGKRLLLGGARNIAPTEEETAEFGQTNTIKNHLIEFMQNKLLPHTPFQIDQWWSGIMGIGATKAPIVKKHSAKISLAVRLGGMGVALGSKVAQQAAQLLLAKK